MAISKDDILARVDSYDILNHYLQPFHTFGARLTAGKNISNPLIAEKQKTPSFNIFPALPSHEWRYKDFATDDEGSCFDLVMKLFNLDFPAALAKINVDFALGSENNQTQTVPPIKEKFKKVELAYSSFLPRQFTEKEMAYWFDYSITPEILNLYNVKAVEKYTAINKEDKEYTITSKPDNPIFAYTGEEWAKIYKPKDKKFRFQHLGNKPSNFVFGFQQLPDKDDLVLITAGEKDVMSLHAKGYAAVSLNSETAIIPSDLLTQLKPRFKNIIILYDNDETGLKQSQKLSDQHSLKRIVLPEMKDGKDISDYFKNNYSLEELQRLIDKTQPEPKNLLQSFQQMAIEGAKLKDLKKVFGNYILENSTVLFPSERGAGKTYIMLQLAIEIANGATHFCGERLEVHGNVLYINLELGHTMMKRRMTKLYRAVPEGNYQYHAFCMSFRSNIEQRFAEIRQVIEKHKPVLVIIDNLRSAFSDKNNEKNQEMTKAIMDLNKMKDDYHFSFVIVHHTKKGSRDKLTDSDLQSGAGAITDLVDADFFLRKSKLDNNLRLLKRIKSRECEEQEGAKLIRMNPDTLWFELVEENVEESDHIFQDVPVNDKADKKNNAFQMRGEGKTLQEIADHIGVNKSTISRWFPKE